MYTGRASPSIGRVSLDLRRQPPGRTMVVSGAHTLGRWLIMGRPGVAHHVARGLMVIGGQEAQINQSSVTNR